nr:hypothetical protein [Tanacetum cinerariifolium]
MSSPTYAIPSDVDEEYAFPSANILNYTSTLPNYFPATPGNISSDFLENSKNHEVPPVFSPFYNNPMQAFYAKESPIPPQDPITPPTILTPSLVLPPSLLFNPCPEDFLPSILLMVVVIVTVVIAVIILVVVDGVVIVVMVIGVEVVVTTIRVVVVVVGVSFIIKLLLVIIESNTILGHKVANS